MARPADWPAAVYDLPLAQAMRDIGAGLRSWPTDPAKKRHHFVARFILSNYATVPADGTVERLVQLDKRSGTPVRVRPEEAASRRRFYAVESDESPRDNRIEDFLAFVEGYAADPVRTLLERPMELTESERTTISMLLALQERRTPYGIAEAGAATEQFGRDSLAMLASDADAFAAAWSQVADTPASVAEIEEHRRELLAVATDGRLHLGNQREQGLLMMLDGHLAAAEVIDTMHWHLLRPTGTDEFIQNDQGVARLDTSTTFSAPQVTPQWVFPLAPDACLLVRQGDRRLSVHDSTHRGSLDLNLRIYGWAEQFVFGRSQQTVASVHAAAKRQPAKAASPPRARTEKR